jgi:hypothetical protein
MATPNQPPIQTDLDPIQLGTILSLFDEGLRSGDLYKLALKPSQQHPKPSLHSTIKVIEVLPKL